MRRSIITEIEELGHASALSVEIEFEYTPAEAPIPYYPDGSGYPGSPAGAEWTNILVHAWIVGDERRLRSFSRVWNELDVIAAGEIENDWETYRDRCIEAERAFQED